MLRSSRASGYLRLLSIGMGAVSGYAALVGVAPESIVPLARTMPQLTPWLELAGL